MLHGAVIVRIWLLLGSNSLKGNSLVWQRSRLLKWIVRPNGIFAAGSRYEAILHCCFSVEEKKSVSTVEAETLNRCTTSFCARQKTNYKNADGSCLPCLASWNPVWRSQVMRMLQVSSGGCSES
ncbi:thioredoxin domain containing 5 [Phyllostomus discolor]|uniref:Thioredoxin domain containing 5 n=1 Tax=Phyllostomus discolor TaxID=89673 RepID=A0A834AJM9_9CHIR|nr:thioredoxin domain containing 5 [Phyllostomus discolor]